MSAVGEVWELLEGSAGPHRIEITGELASASGARLWRWRALDASGSEERGVFSPADLALRWRRLGSDCRGR